MKRSSTSASDQIAENIGEKVADRKMKKIRLEEDEESSSVEDNIEFESDRIAEKIGEKVVDRKMKQIEESSLVEDKIESVMLDENLLYEVLKHADARTLGACACVNKQWHKTSQDERLWELICTKQSANIECGKQQLRSVVLALGGFRRLHALYLWPLAKPPVPIAAPQATTSAWPCLPPPVKSAPAVAPAKKRWGKDEVNLSLSLLSIRYYEKMNFSGRGK